MDVVAALENVGKTWMAWITPPPNRARYRPLEDHRKQIVLCLSCRDEHGRMSNETTRWAGVWPGYRTGRCWMRQGTQKTPLGKLDTSETGGATQADRRQHPSR